MQMAWSLTAIGTKVRDMALAIANGKAAVKHTKASGVRTKCVVKV